MTDTALDFLRSQHLQVTELLDQVENGPTETRQQAFDELRELLAVHETAEELILRPITRAASSEGAQIAAARFAEENQSKDALAKLEKMDTGTAEFIGAFAAFAADVREHAANEESLEFPVVEAAEKPDVLENMAAALKAVEKLAPTHPHPSARSNAANLVLGPFAAMADRVRDALASR